MSTVLYLLFWAALFFVFMRFGCGAHIMGHGRHSQQRRRSETEDRFNEPAMAVDPVCGMTVATPGAKSTVHRGMVSYFCSATCRDKFEADPQAYLGKPGAAERDGMSHGHGA